MGKTYDACTDAEAQNVSTAIFAAVRLLADATAEYTDFANNAGNPTDQAAYATAAKNADAERVALNAEYSAWLNSGGSVTPPLDSEVTEIVNTADSLAQAIATNAQASDILQLVEHGLLVVSSL